MSGDITGTTETSGVSGNSAAAPSGTAGAGAQRETSTAGAYGGQTPAAPPAVVLVDTEGVQGGEATTHTVEHPYASTLDTTQPGAGGTPVSDPAYRAPGGAVAGSTKDTTLTDVQPAGGPLYEPSTGQNITGTVDTGSIGAAGSGTGTAAPVAPTSVVVVAGPRQVLVSWTAPADPANDPVRGYVILGSTGGTTYVGDVLSAVVTNLDDSRSYTFQVAAINRKGTGPLSTASAAVSPYNPDAADVDLPAGIAAANRVNPVYLPAGGIKPGTGGTNNAPAIGAVVAGAADSEQVTVNWTAPTIGATPTSFNVLASDGTATTSTAGTTSKVVTHATGGGSVTYKVTAVNANGLGEQSAASAAVTVP